MIVLDASVILKWLFANESGRDKALQIRDKHQTGEDVIAVPDLLPYEITNTLATKTAVPEPEALAGVGEILGYELQIHPLEAEDFAAVVRFVRERRISAYDAAYVHLAQKLKCDLVTADEKLYKKTKSLPFVRLL